MSHPPPSSATDAELLARHVAGDRDAFAEIVRRHRDRLWAVALRTLGNREDAADGLQDALLSAHRSAAGFRADAAVSTWLHRIVVNACLDLARRRSVRPSVPLDGWDGADPRQAARAGDATAAADSRLVVLAGLRQLPPEQRAALVLVDIEGFSVAEASDILEVPQGTVKSRCARGRARLADLLRPQRPSAVPTAGNAGSAPGVSSPTVDVDKTPSTPPTRATGPGPDPTAEESR